MNRRDFLKTTGFSLAGLAAMCMGCGSGSATSAPAANNTTNNEGAGQAMNKQNGKKVLIAYYSWSGNTKAVAEEIHKQIGGDLQAIVPVTPYSETYAVTVAKAKQEQLSNARPAIKTQIPNIDEYDTVLLGYPNWWGSYPMLIATFAENNKLDGKTIAPFYTHGGGGEQRCSSDLRKLLPKANIQEGLCLSGSSARSAQGEVSAWLKSLGF
ncbi:flavodoxin [uncultured Phascolarctobacterium sp.]|uniref:flavodoxin n=1 Tax=uncultured Phascolarctobacterium sp. TaxID=512296 RepID=UPI0026018340|nr:flavodoxin [uncultured Phascolarctobacterium sp.]